jgi:hypothetical protein
MVGLEEVDPDVDAAAAAAAATNLLSFIHAAAKVDQAYIP